MLLLKPLTARSGDIKHLDDEFTVIKTAIEFRTVHEADRFVCHFFWAIDTSSIYELLELPPIMGLGPLDKFLAESSQWLLQSWRSQCGCAASWWLLAP